MVEILYCHGCGSCVAVETGDKAPAIADHNRVHKERGTTAAITVFDSETEALSHYKGIPGFFRVEEYNPPYWPISED